MAWQTEVLGQVQTCGMMWQRFLLATPLQSPRALRREATIWQRGALEESRICSLILRQMQLQNLKAMLLDTAARVCHREASEMSWTCSLVLRQMQLQSSEAALLDTAAAWQREASEMRRTCSLVLQETRPLSGRAVPAWRQGLTWRPILFWPSRRRHIFR